MPTNWGSRSFNGTSDTITGSVIINPTAATLSVWVNTNSFTNAYSMVAGVANSTTTHFQILTKSTGKAAYYIGATATVSVDPGTATMSTGTWYHLALTYDSSTGLKTYLNGVSDGTAAANGAILSTGSILLQFGNQVGLTRWVNGSIADGAVWNTVLTAAEIKALSQGQRPSTVRPASLISWLPLDGLQSTEPDLSGTKNNGTLTGTTAAFGPPLAPFTPRWPQAPRTFLPQDGNWGSRSFNGVSDKIIGASNTPINFQGNQTFSASAWFNLTSNLNTFMPIIGHANMASNQQGWELSRNGTGNGLQVSLTSSFGAGTYIQKNTNTNLTALGWHHVGFTYTGSTNAAGVTLYIDGAVPAATVNHDNLGASSMQSTTLPQIGTRSDGSQWLTGNLADIAVWNVTLTASEFSALFNGARPSTVRPKSVVSWWPLDGLQSPEEELSGNANIGTVTGTTPAFGPPYSPFTPRWPQQARIFLPTDGNWGSRIFTGVTDKVQANAVATGVTTFTLSCWAQFSAVTSAEIAAINGDATHGYGFQSNGSSNITAFIAGIIAFGATAISNNVWMHLCMARVGGVTTFYVNGVSKGTASNTPNAISGNLTIGNQNNNNSAGTGRTVADVGIWNTNLSVSEIVALSKGARPNTIRPASLQGWWPCDGLQSPEPDISGLSNNGTVTGSVPAFGPPYMPFTPRWQQDNNAIIPIVAGFKPQFALGKNIVIEGVAT